MIKRSAHATIMRLTKGFPVIAITGPRRSGKTTLYFWRDSKGLEVDLLLDDGINLKPVEIKSSQTIVPDFLVSLKKWCELSGNPDRPAALVYGGDRELTNGNVAIIPWRKLADLMAG